MTFDPRARAAQIAKEASDQISGEWPLLMNDLERIVESALIRFAAEERARCIDICEKDLTQTAQKIANVIRGKSLEGGA